MSKRCSFCFTCFIMSLHNYIFAILLAICLLSTTTQSQKTVANLPSSSNLNIIEGTFSGIDYQIASIETAFDDSIHIPQAASCPYCDPTAPYSNTTCLCDYTDVNNCGKTAPGCPPCGRERGVPSDPCSGRFNWTVVEFDVPFEFLVSIDTSIAAKNRFRVYNDQPCQALWIEVQGNSSVFIMDVFSPEFVSLTDNSGYSRGFGDGSYSYVCPSWNWMNPFFSQIPVWRPGTVEFALRFPGSLSSVTSTGTITLRRIPVKTIPDTPIPSSCENTPAPGGVPCLEDKVNFETIENQESTILAYKVIGCRTVSFMMRSNAISAKLYITRDPQDLNVTLPEITLWSNGYGTRKLVQTFCAKSSTDYFHFLLRFEQNEDPDSTISTLLTIDSVPALRSPGVSSYSPLFRLQPIQNLSHNTVLYDLFATANLTKPQGTLSCRPILASEVPQENDTCIDFFPSTPLVPTPFYPVPEWISEYYIDTQSISFLQPRTGPLGVSGFSQVIEFFQQPPTPQKTITFYALIQYQTGVKSIIVRNNLTDLLASSIKFTGILTDSKGNLISGSVPIKEKPFAPCNRSDYQKFSSAYTKALDLFTSIDLVEDIAAQRYYVESAFTHPGYYQCSNELKTFAKPAEPVLYSLLVCNKTKDDLGYAEDPCCTKTGAWNAVCDQPEELSLPSFSVRNDLVTSNCARPDCLGTYLGDYFSSKKGVGCPSALSQTSDVDYDLLTIFKKCFVLVYGSTSLGSHGRGGTRCYGDSDCPTGVQCDMQFRVCPVSNQKQLDDEFMNCYVNSIGPSDLAVFAKNLRNDSVPLPESLLPGYIVGNFSTIDWSLPDAKVYMLDLIYSSSSLMGVRLCNNPALISGWAYNQKQKSSYLFITNEDGSYSLQRTTEPIPFIDFPEYNPWNYDTTARLLSELTSCPNTPSCLSTSFTCTTPNCTATCRAGTFACMMCRDQQTCVEAPGVTTPEQCAQTKACLRPVEYGVPAPVNFNLTEDQCLNEEHEFCTQPCGYTCGRIPFNAEDLLNEGGYCINTAITSNSACTASGGARVVRTACFYNLNRTACLSVAGRVFTGGYDCNAANPTLDSCMQCFGKNCSNILSWYHGCGVVPKACPDEDSCLRTAGNCTGSYPSVMTQLSTGPFAPQPGPYPTRNFGACAFPKGSIGDNSNVCNYDRAQWIFGKFCLDFYYTNSSSCIAAGGKWYIPPTDENTCNSNNYWGCYEPVPNENLNSVLRKSYVYGYSPKTKQECLSVYNSNYGYATWRPMFRWVAPQWRKSTVRQPVWKERTVVNRVTTTLGWSFDGLFTFSKSALTVSRQATGAKAEILCKSSASVDILQFSTCSCYNEGTSFEKCITGSTSIPTASNRLCPGILLSPLTANNAEIATSENSTTNLCSNIQVFPLPATNFKVSEQLTLASSLIKLNQFAPFDITNEKGATIGTILASGATVVSELQLNHYSVCFLPTTQDRSVPMGEKQDMGLVDSKGKLLPMDLNTVPDDLGRICFFVQNPPRNASYLLVSHIPNWKDKQLEYFPRDTVVLLYVLAALFLLATLFCTLAWISYFFTPKEGNFRHQTFFTIMFTFLFCIIRCIYFFMLPKGLSSQSADYVLIVLPTFFYFSSVIQLITTWVALATLSLTRLSKATKFTNAAAIGLHILLYIIFLIIVLLFHFNQPESKPSCGNRIIYSPDYSTQKKLSLAYAIIIAVFSVLLGVGFLAFGLKTVSKFKKSLSDGVKKVAITTGIYAGAFVLHCIYVFLLIFTDASVVFVFVGFIITEIIPACYLMINHIQYRKVIAAVATMTAKTNKSKSNSKESKIQMSSVATDDLLE
eukprot:TRINITY_DN785_c0_g1_i4.p1 TRINITY_DN785_c0_g1~~TRINITY_DN785_c0_g1_i4.p1  ORF type:complete len:1818 (-),score=339.05 TRINITY_DN785_c0_g1_i4:163-5616(-)